VLGLALGLALGLVLESVVELGELIDPLLAPPVVLLDVPLAFVPELPAYPLDCAHDAPATATNAAATTVAIFLTITIESPWSVEEDCARGVARVVPGWL